MKAVVTGATGHIGSALVRELLTRGYSVRAVIPDFEDPSSLDGLDIERVSGDIRNLDALVKAFEGIEIVFHLAGIVSIGNHKWDLLYQVNVVGTQNVIAACKRTGVKRLVYTSSVHAIEEAPKGTAIVESREFDPAKVDGDYAKSKAMATRAVFQAIEDGLDAVIVHPSGVVGPYEYKLSNLGQLFMDFIQKRVPGYVDGEYDFVDVRDVARGMVQVCEKGRKGENYILAGEQVSTKKLLYMLREVTGVKLRIRRYPIWIAKVLAPFFQLYAKLAHKTPILTSYSIRTLNSNSLFSYDKAKREVGYSARPFIETVRDTVKWLTDRYGTEVKRRKAPQS